MKGKATKKIRVHWIEWFGQEDQQEGIVYPGEFSQRKLKMQGVKQRKLTSQWTDYQMRDDRVIKFLMLRIMNG